MRSLPTSFVQTAHAETNTPIWLYRIEAPATTIDAATWALIQADEALSALFPSVSSAGNAFPDIYMAEWDDDVTFDSQVYIEYPLKRTQITENMRGQIDSLRLIICNVSRGLQAFLEYYDALRAAKVTIRQVFQEDIADPTAYTETIFTVDRASVTEKEATLHLTSRMDVFNVVLPQRTYSRWTCQWGYKSTAGCWLANGSAPADFVAGSPDTCSKTFSECSRHSNTVRFGGFPSVPSRRTYSE